MRHAFPTSVDRLYQFSGFVVDPVIGRLHHGDQEVRLTQKAFAVLIALIEHHGEVIARRELKERVWPGTAVDENNLTQCISMLRKAFYERQPQTEFIATVLGQGYRFVPAVTEVEREALGHHALDAAPSMVSAPPDIAHSADSRATRRTAVRASVAIAAGSLLIASGWWLARPKEFALHNTAAAHVAERRLWRLTSASRLETEPSWSPDGRFLAYSSDRSGNLDIWVQAVDGIATRVTSSQAPESYPAWSPDGRLIAFTREGTGAGIFVVRAAGGPEKQIADFGARPQWSADGSAILFYSSARPGRREGFLVGLDGSVPRAVPTPIPGMQLVGLAWHPDGRLSVFGTKPTGDQVFLTMTLDGRQTVISSIAAAVAMRVKEAELTLGDFVWAPDGSALYFDGRSGQSQNLWRVPVDPKTLMWTDGPERLTTTTGYEDSMTLSPDGRRLAFSSRTERTQVWSFPFDPQSGRLVGQGELVTSGGADVRMLDVSKDGNRLAYLTLNAGRTKVWAHSFGEEAKLVSVEENASITGPRWSPDGSLLSYLRPTASRGRSTDLVLVDPADGERRIYDMKTLGLTIERPLSIHDWTPDGAGLLVSCRPASGRRGMCSLSLNPEAASGLRVIASDRDRDLFEGRVSPDGKWISFIASPNPASSTVFVTPITGGPWIPITNRSAYDDKPRWAPNGRTVYFLSNRTGFFNVWGQRLDPIAKVPLGKPFQVTDFELSSQMVTPDIMSAQIGVTKNRLILPIKEASGAVWVLEPLKQ